MANQEPSDPSAPFRDVSKANVGYEFNDHENGIIREAGTWATALAVISFISAVSGLCSANYLGVAINTFVGSLFLAIGAAFKKIVTSEDADLVHLMQALERFGVLLLVRLVATVLVLAGAVVTLLALTQRHG